jgi:hypothetical protein
MSDTGHTLPQLKRVARLKAYDSGHILGRFADSDPEHGAPYALARCISCVTQCAVVSPTRYGVRLMGGGALDASEPCRNPLRDVDPEWLAELAAMDDGPTIPMKLVEERPADVCGGCNKEIDLEVCHCGSYIKDHGYEDGHSAVPMGCICGYPK